MLWVSLCTSCLDVGERDDNATCSACGGKVELYPTHGEVRLRIIELQGSAFERGRQRVRGAAMDAPRTTARPTAHPASVPPTSLTREEVARRLGCGLTKVKELERRGALVRAKGVGRAARITIASVEALERRLDGRAAPALIAKSSEADSPPVTHDSLAASRHKLFAKS
jgi:hypothetical protein